MGLELESYERDRARTSRRTPACFRALPAGLLGPRSRCRVGIHQRGQQRKASSRAIPVAASAPRPPPRVLCSSGPSVRVCEGARPGQMLSQASSEGHVSGRRSRPGDLRFLWSELPTLGLSCGFWS